MQDRRNCDRSYGDRIYLHEECAGWKNLSGSGVGVSHYVFLLKGKDHKTGRNGNGINSFDMNKKNKVEKKRQKEQYVVEEMIRLYCRKKHKEYDKTTGKMCPSCQELSDYARLRSQKCPFMEEKTFCANCKVHCYKPEMREKIRVVMRFSGPRMLLYHPVLAVWHLICSKKESKK